MVSFLFDLMDVADYTKIAFITKQYIAYCCFYGT